VFEPSAEVIHKGKAGKPNEFGKMVKLQESIMKSTFAAPMTELLIPSANENRRDAGSATARNGAPDARDASTS
jgi:hypothetical protein